MLNAVESLRDAKLSVLTLERAAQVVQSHVTMHRALMLACLSCFVLQLTGLQNGFCAPRTGKVGLKGYDKSLEGCFVPSTTIY